MEEFILKRIKELYRVEASLETLKKELPIDSLDFYDLILSIEDSYSIYLPDEALDNIRTVGDLVRLAEEIGQCHK